MTCRYARCGGRRLTLRTTLRSIDGDLVTHRSRRLLEATLTLLRAGVPLGEVLDAGDFVQTQAAADRFVALFRAHAIGTEGLEQLSATRLRHITEAVAAPRPLAGEVVAIEFARDSGRGRLRPRAGKTRCPAAVGRVKLLGMSQSTVETHAPTRRGVADLFTAAGRLTVIPRKAARREQLLGHLTETLFAEGRDYTEPEVNGLLLTVHEDCAALRRYLVIAGHLTRTRDGSGYRRATTTL